MKKKLRFLEKNKQSIIALFVLLVMAFNACNSPVSPPSVSPDPSDFTPTYFYVDSDGNFCETDSGKTVLVTDEKAEVVFYSDNIESSDYNRVALTFEDKTIFFFFEKDQDFPDRIVFSDSGESYNGICTPYDPETQTYSLTLDYGDDEKETFSNIVLSKDKFTQYEDDPELTPSQNLRMRNLYIASCIYKSMDEYINSGDTLQARGIWGKIAKFFSNPKVIVAIVAVAVVVLTVATGGIAAIAAGSTLPVALATTAAIVVSGLEAALVLAEEWDKVDSYVYVTDVSLFHKSISLVVGAVEALGYTIIPTNATNKNVNWRSSNNDVVKVADNGVVKADSVGNAIITVTTIDGNKKATCDITVNPVSVTGVTLNKTSVSLFVGGTETLTPTIEPSNAANKTVSWNSNNTSIATVSSDGTVRGLSVGSAIITVKTADGEKTASCTVTVNSIPVSSVSVKPSTSLVEGSTETLSAAIIPSNATDQNVTWNSSNTAVATVSSNGTVSAVSAGTATITVKTMDGNKTATCNVTVVAGSVAVTGVSLNKSSASLDVGSVETLTAVIAPSNATNQNVTWSSSNTAVATVSSGGIVTAIAPGTATITVVSVDGNKTAACTVIINTIPVSSVSMKSSTSLVVGGTEILSAAIMPSNATNQNVSWSSSNTAVVTVSSNGTVSAVSAGLAIITVKTADGNKTAACNVTVVAGSVAVTGVSLNKSSASLDVGSAETLTAVIAPSNATNQNVIWSSSNTAVASVSNSGMVSGLSVGTATITVTTVDGNKTAVCTVSVYPISVSSVSIKSSTSLVEGSTETLSATIIPSNATNQNITWSSNNTAVATVSSNGTVSAVSAGSAIITVKTADGNKTAACNVTVVAGSVAVTGVSLNKSSASLDVGSVETLTAVIAPSNATNQNVTWNSSNTAVATVTEGGKITAVAPGTATIIVTAVDTKNGIKTAVCTIIVNPVSVTSVTLKKTSISLPINGIETFSVLISPSDATNQNVTWSSNNTDVVRVTTGKVTAVAPGEAIITVTAADTTKGVKSDSCIVTVMANSWIVYDEPTWNGTVTSIKNGGNNKTYNINVTDSFSMTGVSVNTFGSVTGITVTIAGDKEISLAAGSTGRLLRIGANQDVIINDLDLKGNNTNTISLVYIDGVNSYFTMQGNATVSGNTGSGVSVYYGTIIMQDHATVSGNTGSGVSVYGTFTMKDHATVSGNTGGGVYISDGTFTMKDNAMVNGNTDHGVFVLSGIFTMQGNAKVSNNSSSDAGGGVFVVSGIFTMQGNAMVSNNSAITCGGGVYVGGGVFTMQNNVMVSGNTIPFTTIFGEGGGVYVESSGTFTLIGGTVYGNVGLPMGNTCSNGGVALYLGGIGSVGIAKYGDGTNILPHTDGKANYTNNTIQR